jgi:esterase/lipase superfamily enzyme
VDLRIPSVHVPGNVRLPGKIVDPTQDFLVSGTQEFRNEDALVGSLRQRLAALPADEREVIVFVHGYNMSAAQGLVRMAQLQHDLNLPGIPALFSWPSAGSVLGYAYDRDSTLFSRDAYERYLRAIARSQPRRMILVAHSMGALLTMETLRQIALSDPGWIERNVGGVVLISPDIAVDVFRSQVARIGTLPEPFAIFVSKNDRALALAARVSGDDVRLGSVTNPADLADLNVVLLDVSLFSQGIGHFDFGRSPSLLALVSQIAEVELSFDEDPSGRAGLFAGTLLTVQNATRIILSPISE